MTGYEASDLINGIWSNILAGQALWLSATSAYLLVAFSAGARLTRFQVVFVNLMFILFSLSAVQGFYSQATAAAIYNAIRVEELGAALDFGVPGGGNVVMWTIIALRILFCVGSLVFMWDVRRKRAG